MPSSESTSTSITLPAPAYTATSTVQAPVLSPPYTDTEDGRHAVIEVDKSHGNVTTTAGWPAWLPVRLQLKRQQCTLTPEHEYQRRLRCQVVRNAVYLALAASVFVGSCIGASWSTSSLRRYSGPDEATLRKLHDLIGSEQAGEPGSQEEEHSSEGVAEVYLSAIFFFILAISFMFTVLNSGRLALAVHYRKLAQEESTDLEETFFWTRMFFLFGNKSMRIKKPRLPTYGHAVRQAVLKRGARQGDAQTEFFNITAEELELERIRKLGGAPPTYCQP